MNIFDKKKTAKKLTSNPYESRKRFFFKPQKKLNHKKHKQLNKQKFRKSSENETNFLIIDLEKFRAFSLSA